MSFLNVFIFFYVFMVLNIVTFNARGLLDFNKFGKMKEMCKNEHVIVLQETNWRETHINDVRKRWEGKIVYNNEDKRYGRGVAFLIRENENIACKEIYKDKIGKCLAVEIEYEEKKIVMINVHAPSEEKEKKEFFKVLRMFLTKHKNIILLGDFNTVLSKMDMADGMVYKTDTGRRELNLMMENNNLVEKGTKRRGNIPEDKGLGILCAKLESIIYYAQGF